MISERDVIKVCMPFPNDTSGLALLKHYYICNQNNNNNKLLFKCQTQKPNMITKYGRDGFREKFYPIRSNSLVPFRQDTVVDKEQVFNLQNTTVPLIYLSQEKPSNIPISIYGNVVREISGPRSININKAKFVTLNPGCT